MDIKLLKNIPADLIPTPGNAGYAKDLGKELREIRKRVAPFNPATKRPTANPFKEGDLFLIYQQQMEKTHKLSPRWQGPFSIVKIPNSFQVIYLNKGREKLRILSTAKNFRRR